MNNKKLVSLLHKEYTLLNTIFNLADIVNNKEYKNIPHNYMCFKDEKTIDFLNLTLYLNISDKNICFTDFNNMADIDNRPDDFVEIKTSEQVETYTNLHINSIIHFFDTIKYDEKYMDNDGNILSTFDYLEYLGLDYLYSDLEQEISDNYVGVPHVEDGVCIGVKWFSKEIIKELENNFE